jgi:2-methylcitrate dehydratase PrpD
MPSRQGIVEVTLTNGETLSEHTLAVRGTPGNPMTRQELQDKCMELLGPVLGAAQAARLCATVWSIEDESDARNLASLLQPNDSYR